MAALARLGHPPRRTVYLGESLGTGVVAALQARHPPAGLVLRSPFPQLSDVGAHHYPWLPVRALLRDRFPVVEHLSTSDVPTTVVYGDRDTEAWFRERYAASGRTLSMGKSCVRFRSLEEVPLDVIGEAVARVDLDSFVAHYEAARGSSRKTRAATG